MPVGTCGTIDFLSSWTRTRRARAHRGYDSGRGFAVDLSAGVLEVNSTVVRTKEYGLVIQREAVMAYWNLPHTTADRWIRQARAVYPLPGPHSEEASRGERS